jgi:glucose-6-phosphate isomerase
MSSNQRIQLDWTKIQDVVPLESEISKQQDSLSQALHVLLGQKQFEGSNFLGWVKYVQTESKNVLSQIKETVENIQSHSNALVVIGIGGSLLGTKAIYEALSHSFVNVNPQQLARKPVLFWAGHHLATDELAELLEALENFTPSLLVVSKSGGTTEPAIAFRVLKQYLEERFGESESSARIFAVTDPHDGVLNQICQENSYTHFPIPKNVGGRYSLFTPVGLLPLAVAGINVENLVEGAQQAFINLADVKNTSFDTNPALCYAAIRNTLYQKNYKVESLCFWTPKLRATAEWWKQLFGESDGKNNTGIFPSSVQFTTDLHSMGQYFQEGERILFATHMQIHKEQSGQGSVKKNVTIPSSNINDGFEFMSRELLQKVQIEAQQGTYLAHADGKVPTMIWEIPELDAYWMGYWLYANMLACGVGGIARGVNPFDQPGVEAYKTNMFALLGKPGTQNLGVQLKSRLEKSGRMKSVSPTQRMR